MLTALVLVLSFSNGLQAGRVITLYGSPTQCEAARKAVEVEGFRDADGKLLTYSAACVVVPQV